MGNKTAASMAIIGVLALLFWYVGVPLAMIYVIIHFIRKFW